MTIEEKAKEYCPDDAYPFGPDIINKEVRKAFVAGYNLCREQMMEEEAVEGEVMLNPYPTICLDDCKDYNFKDAQKVRIIIVKEDGK